MSWSDVTWSDVTWSDVLAAADVTWEDAAEGEVDPPVEHADDADSEEEQAAEADPLLGLSPEPPSPPPGPCTDTRNPERGEGRAQRPALAHSEGGCPDSQARLR